jgi:hypothetical protein
MFAITALSSRILDRRTPKTGLSALLLLICLVSTAPTQAGILVGNSVDVPLADKNDHIDDVQAVIDAYNVTHDPDLTKDIALFKKTDDDAIDLFNATNDNNGFSFFESDMTPITSEGSLLDSSTAFFSYDGPENLWYYSVKGGTNGFSLYTLMAGLNLLTIDGSTQDISHVSFWLGTDGLDPFGNPIPEPATWVLCLTAMVICSRRVRL